ncbi:MAG: hypothetical protein JJD98_06880 [Polaromonas sp.]|nr:hypothetical protein [Polaromonas sp.]
MTTMPGNGLPVAAGRKLIPRPTVVRPDISLVRYLPESVAAGDDKFYANVGDN